MKIGILTFHWATNYGAVLQTYATQSFLYSIGHEPVVINYKPSFYDISLKSVMRAFRNGTIKELIVSLRKEADLKIFRKKYLLQTERVKSIKNLPAICLNLECLISGSDQVMNASFLTFGEGKRVTTPSYYLGFDFSGKRVGYAVSFGVVSFPSQETEIAKPFIVKFDKISTREASGADIVASMGRYDAIVVPDPTILLPSTDYHKLADSVNLRCTLDTYCFFIRHIEERKSALMSIYSNSSVLWNNDDGDYTLEGWLYKIKHARFVITDSFHCMVMCLKLHTPFAVVTELDGNTGMNDRFYTLLELLGLVDRIIYKDKVTTINSLSNSFIDWILVDSKLEKYKNIGVDFLKAI